MKRWPVKPLGEIAEVRWGNTTLTKASYVERGFAAFSATGEDGFLPSYEHEGDGIVLSAIGANCGKCFSAKGKWTAIKNTITITSPAEGICTIRYLFRFLNDEDLWPKRGGGQPFISQGDARKIAVPLPPLAEQERIVQLLDEADELRKLRAQADDRTAALIPALFHEMFGDPATNPKSFRIEPLEKLIRVKSGDALPAKDMDVGGEFPVYGGNGISGYHSKFMFEQPMVVIGRVGVYCGAVHLSEPKSWITDNALYVSEMKERFDQQYLVAALRVANFNQYAGRAAQPLVSGSRIYPVRILIPPLALQKEFAKRVTEIRKLESEQAASRARLDALFQSTLHRAFAGDL